MRWGCSSLARAEDFARAFSNAEIRAFAAERQAPVVNRGGSTRLSVVLPSYNQARFIRRTLNTIANQHYGNLQLIVMDGGSTDGSQAIIEEFRDIIDIYKSGPDAGQAAAINKGLARCDGEFLAWQNSDDLYLPGFFHTIDAAVLKHPDADLIIANNYHVDPDDRIIMATRYGPFSISYLAYLDWNLSSQSVFVRRQLAARVGPLPNYEAAFDYEWFLRVTKAARHIVEIKRYGGCYRIHPDSKFSTADRAARDALERRILASLGYKLDLDRPLTEQWALRRALWQRWQRLNQRILYTEQAKYLPIRWGWAAMLKLFRPRMLGYLGD